MPCSSKSVTRDGRLRGVGAGAFAALLACLACLTLATSAEASDPMAFVTEVLTPAGWELYGVWCGDDDEFAGSSELRIPDGWGNPTSREEPSWDGWGNPTSREEPRWVEFACSEVVVPPEWRAFALQAP